MAMPVVGCCLNAQRELQLAGWKARVTVQVNAVQLGLISAQCFHEWKEGGDIKEKCAKAAAVGAGLIAAGLVYRSSQNNKIGGVV
jgi:hypothetical protein